MAKYLLVMVGNEQRWNSMSDDEWRAIDEGHRTLRERAGDGILADGQLEDSSKWTTVRVGADGAQTAADGPFAETKEMIGGFYVVDVPDREAAVSLARELAETRADHSGVEVIPLVVH
ncbi:MAG TPA: YciI family protein [Humibacter sp.]|nr:YciI family protein [Humibacter sp.]